MPWELLSHPDIGLLFDITLLIDMAQIAFINFIVLYFSLIKERSPSGVGIPRYFMFPDWLVY
jgi:hypothetical protein